MEKIRLQKILAQSGIASRRKSEELIENKKVTINGKIAKIGDKASFDDEILVENNPIFKEEKIYYLLNKPRKVVTTLKDNFNRTIITDLINEKNHKIFPVGRLDYDTTGIIILTNDGDLANRLSHPKYEINRIYEVITDKEINLKELKFLNSNKVIINEKKSHQEVLILGTNAYSVKIHQGSYHHIKELFKLVNANVKKLNRVEYAFLNLKNLPIGHYRLLKQFEIKKLKRLVELI